MCVVLHRVAWECIKRAASCWSNLGTLMRQLASAAFAERPALMTTASQRLVRVKSGKLGDG